LSNVGETGLLSVFSARISLLMINRNNYYELPAFLNTVNNGKWILTDVKFIIMLIFIAAPAWVIAGRSLLE